MLRPTCIHELYGLGLYEVTLQKYPPSTLRYAGKFTPLHWVPYKLNLLYNVKK